MLDPDPNPDPESPASPRDQTVFGLMWIAFWCFLGWFAPRAGGTLVAASVATGACLLVALAFDPASRRRLGLRLLPPLLLLGLGLGAPLLPSPLALAAGAAIGVVGGGLLIATGLGPPVRSGWMAAFHPVAWTISTVLLAAVYCAILTPTGLVMRLVGRDPLHRRFDRSAASYWIARRPSADPARYFRQS